MSRGTFNGLAQSPWSADHAARELREWHQAREQRNERDERAAKWIAAQLVGESYDSYEALQYAALRATETRYARPVTDEEREILTRACRGLWMGVTRRAVLAPVRCVVDGERVSFAAAA